MCERGKDLGHGAPPRRAAHRDPHNRYLQADLDGHQYNYGTRTAVKQVLHLSKYLEMGYGYVVEARKEPELPEVMCCSCKVLKFQLGRATPFPPGAAPAGMMPMGVVVQPGQMMPL